MQNKRDAQITASEEDAHARQTPFARNIRDEAAIVTAFARVRAARARSSTDGRGARHTGNR